MQPGSLVLRALAGPLSGREFEIGPAGLGLGRDPSNDIQVGDATASRFHCRLELAGEDLCLIDLGSHHGSYVNGAKVNRCLIKPGDQVSVANSLFTVKRNSDSKSLRSLELPMEEGRYHRPEGFLSEAAGDIGALGAVLLRAAQALGEFREADAIADRLLELLLEASSAERAALLFFGRSGEQRLRQMRPGQQGSSSTEPLSENVIERVMSGQVALVVEDVSESTASWLESLVAQQVRAFVGVPLLDLRSRPIGLLYLESTSRADEMERSELEFLTAFAGLASTALTNLLRFEWLEAERRRLHTHVVSSEMIGESEPIKKVVRIIERVASTDTTVLVLGDSGTGKEVAAKMIHCSSPRADRPFVAVNCAALTESLLESELFGHEKGAFSGAHQQKAGRIEIADSGTLFLDEVGEMSPALQAKLLRVLEERNFERVGGTRAIEVDIRVLAATNRDLRKEIKDGNFRDDLFYRLSVLSIALPPLRARDGDVMLLADHLRAKLATRIGCTVAGFTPAARQALESYAWPGNVRELNNAIERSVILCEGDLIDVHDLPEEIAEASRAVRTEDSYQEALQSTRRRLIVNAVLRFGGRYTEAAKLLELDPNYLHRLIRKFELKEEIERQLERQKAELDASS